MFSLVGINVHRSLPVNPIECHQLHVQRGRPQRHDGLQLQHNQASDQFFKGFRRNFVGKSKQDVCVFFGNLLIKNLFHQLKFHLECL